MNFRTFIALVTSATFVLARIGFDYFERHKPPTLKDVPMYLSAALGYLAAWCAVDYFRARNRRP